MKRWHYLSIVAIVLLCFCSAAQADGWGKSKTVVKTKYGWVRGYVAENNTLVWQGVPYAKPPVGDLRWKAPQNPDRWHGILDATENRDECAQMGHHPITWAYTEPIGSEDCLYLNIWRPQFDEDDDGDDDEDNDEDDYEGGLPVYIWIHGGSNNYGTIKEYDGSVIASRGKMVVVTIQYRLGPLGWLTHPALRDDEDDLDASGNFGTLDTFKALKWVKKNIKAFGGDPKNILITGESAGAHNVMNCVISPLAKKLFHKAMSESGGMKTYTMAYGDYRTEVLIANLMDIDGSSYPQDVEAYLKDKTTYELIEGYWHAGSPPSSSAHQDGVVIPEGGVVATIESGKYNKVPIILGSNLDETKFFLPLYPIGTSKGYTWQNLWEVLYPPYSLSLDDVLAEYDMELYEACAYFGSLNWRYNFVDLIARPLREHQKKVYAYHFRWAGEEGSDYEYILGAAHATEIPFFFGADTDIYEGIAFNPLMDTPGRQALSDGMMKYLAEFAHKGRPNARGLPKWKEWSNQEDKEKVIVFDANEDEADIYMISEEITADFVDDEYDRLESELGDPYRKSILSLFNWY